MIRQLLEQKSKHHNLTNFHIVTRCDDNATSTLLFLGTSSTSLAHTEEHTQAKKALACAVRKHFQVKASINDL
jgi:hypothetical protein